MIDWLPALVKTLATGDGAVLLTVVHTAAIGHATHPGPDVPPLSSLPRPQP